MTRHRFDPFSFLVGAVALGVSALVLVGDVSVRLVDLRIIGPVVVLAIGAALLIGGRRDDRPVVVPAHGGDPAGEVEAQPHHAEGTTEPEPEPAEAEPSEPGSSESSGPGATDTLRIERDDG